MAPVETPPNVERVVEGEDYFVAVTFDPKDLLPQILAALGSSALLLGQASRYRNSNSPEARDDALNVLVNSHAVREAFTIRLHGGTADDLAGQLDTHCTEPDRCHASDCDNYELDRSGYCPGHLDALPNVVRL